MRTPSTTRRAGFTLLESMISLSIFAVLGYSIAVVVGTANDSQRTVYRVAAEGRSLRESSSLLTDELRTSTNSQITVTTLADGNSSLTFRMPVESGGNLLWGVFDRKLGADYASQNNVDWSLRYTVVNAVGPDGALDRQLVRQILDAGSVVRDEQVIAHRLNNGTGAHPGFNVVQTGAMWVVTVSSEGHSAGTPGMRAEFHVQTRN
ncbi:MAG: type II secretion system protein [Planctomycetes bacterium]|nr:type II secretion system protein [Planctomycetota bacterium]